MKKNADNFVEEILKIYKDKVGYLFAMNRTKEVSRITRETTISIKNLSEEYKKFMEEGIQEIDRENDIASASENEVAVIIGDHNPNILNKAVNEIINLAVYRGAEIKGNNLIGWSEDDTNGFSDDTMFCENLHLFFR